MAGRMVERGTGAPGEDGGTGARKPDITDSRAVRDLLRDHGLRSTEQRLAVLRALAEADREGHRHGEHHHEHRHHLTVADLHERLGHAGAQLDLTTVYRTLTTLVEIGVVHATAHGPNLTTYGLATDAHHHAICSRCGAVAEIPAADLAPTFSVVHELTGFRAQGAALTVHGVCPACDTAATRPD